MENNIVSLVRFKQTKNSTIGMLRYNDFFCFILEDGYREKKEKGKTRIPAGKYELTFRKEGGFYERYSKYYAEQHWMIELKDVPNFKYILIHKGNNTDDTAGCLITGKFYDLGNDYFVMYSGTAYSELRKVLVPMMKLKTMYIEITEKFE
jgi:hypothetical protein